MTNYIGGTILEALDIARRAVEAADEKQASDIALLDAQPVCSFADYFVICSGDSERQLHSIHDEIEQSLKKEGVEPDHREGKVNSGWLLLDYGSVIIHIFAPQERDYYQLDKLWSKMSTVLHIQ